MTLFIDVADPEVSKLVLFLASSRFQLIWNSKYALSETLLPNIEKLLKEHKLKLNQIKKIIVVRGPGPFSRIRTAVAIANALAFALGIRVIGVKSGVTNFSKLTQLKGGQNFVYPVYFSNANITKPKKRL